MPDQPDDWNIIIPIENLKITMRSLKIGPVRLVRYTKNRVFTLRALGRKMFAQNPRYSHDRESITRHTTPMRELTKDWPERTCAEITMQGIFSDVRKSALNLVEEALNVIKLYRYPNDDFYSRYFGIPGTVIPNVLRATIGYNTRQTRVSMSSSWVGHSYPFEIDENRSKWMRKYGFAEVSKLVGKNDKNEVEDRIITAVHWFAKAFDVTIAEYLRRPVEEEGTTFIIRGIHRDSIMFFDRLIKLMICSETLFVLDRNEALRSAISERAAFLLGDNYRNRREIKRFFGRMYDKRSDLVHGRTLSLDEDDLSKLVLYLQAAIIQLARKRKPLRLITNENLKEWFERKKLGG
jgi:hypothetical protein